MYMIELPDVCSFKARLKQQNDVYTLTFCSRVFATSFDTHHVLLIYNSLPVAITIFSM